MLAASSAMEVDCTGSQAQRSALVSEVHKAHSTHGYRWVAAFIRANRGRSCSDSYIYKAFRYLGIQSETKHKPHYRPRKARDLYPNLIFTTWETVDRSRQVIVSDMTAWKESHWPLSIPTKALCILQRRTMSCFRTAISSAPCREPVRRRSASKAIARFRPYVV